MPTSLLQRLQRLHHLDVHVQEAVDARVETLALGLAQVPAGDGGDALLEADVVELGHRLLDFCARRLGLHKLGHLAALGAGEALEDRWVQGRHADQKKG